ncbi:hypothetical protein VP01_3436g4 [Puccinia sorghi]|uniref:Uncharacterized protein n=1 Tax=Puccinia sorghi TaxID=27349 RepID=A0A0L6UWA3_9BASI|nr:hypothetical protein VP01_3436g4 [Puccinia sorghi]
MVFRRYEASTKIATDIIVSRKCFSCWSNLYHETQLVVRDPKEYTLVCMEPTIFLGEIYKQLYNNGGALLGRNIHHAKFHVKT